MKIATITATGKKSTLAVSDELFAVKSNPTLLSQAVRVYLSNKRQGSSKVKNRSEVTRTKRKWFRQKGTGNARHGARSAPIFVGGGVTHGPRGNQNWKLSLTKKAKKQALSLALTAQVENVVVCDSLEGVDGKTSSTVKILEQCSTRKNKVLLVASKDSSLLERSVRNLPTVRIVVANKLNALDVSSADKVLFTKKSLKELEKRLQGQTAPIKEEKEVKTPKKTSSKETKNKK